MKSSPVTTEYVDLKIATHTLDEREFSDKRYAGKWYERVLNWVIIATAGAVVVASVNYAINKFTNNSNSPARVESAYDH